MKTIFKCGKCKNEVNDSQRFCNHCGSQFDEDSERVAVNAGENSEKIVRYIKLSDLPKEIQKMKNNGDLYGLFQRDGKLYVENTEGVVKEVK
jgi:predicted amidophosphoribosyltransferase